MSVRASRIGIYGHTSFVGLRLFTLSCCSLFIFLFVESGTGIGTANHLPLTSEPQKVVRTAEVREECPYVSVRASRIGIYGHTSLVGLRFIHAFSLFPLSVFHFVESGIEIGTANHLPLTSEPQKAVCTAEAEEECPYVCS